MMSVLYYPSILITGASAGIGEEFARQLACCCDQMILVARRGERLTALAKELHQINAQLEILQYSVDLVDRGARDAFIRELEERGLFPDLLINNAGMGDYGTFAEANWQKIEQMAELNMLALTQMTHALLPKMMEKQSGDIVNVSSLASVLPIPDFAVYAATKAYVTSFSEALRLELKDFNINVLALCPGPVHTEFGEVARRGDKKNKVPGSEFFYVDTQQVVTDAIQGLRRKKPRVYPGVKIAIAAAVISMVPMIGMRLLMGTRPRRGE